MIRSIFKSVFIGILAGAALFFAGFILLRIFLFFLIAGAIFRLFMRRRWKRYAGYRASFNKGAYMNEPVIIDLRKNRHNPNIISID